MGCIAHLGYAERLRIPSDCSDRSKPSGKKPWCSRLATVRWRDSRVPGPIICFGPVPCCSLSRLAQRAAAAWAAITPRIFMQATTDTTGETPLIQKTRDLCQTIVDGTEFRSIRERIDAFAADEGGKNLYHTGMEKGDALQQKQQYGLPLDNNEVAAFEQNREQLLNHPVARSFLDAQQQMHKIQESVMQFVGKTFELGRVPTLDDFASDNCGPTCGCG